MKILFSLFIIFLALASAEVNQNCPAVNIMFVSTDQKVQSDTTRHGSILGGNTLYFQGTGLATNPLNFAITVGTQTCEVDIAQTSDIQLACTLPSATIAAKVSITVTISSCPVTCPSSICYYVYDQAQTPVLQFISPTSVVPGSPLYVGGLFRLADPTTFQLKFNDQVYCTFGDYTGQTLTAGSLSYAKCLVNEFRAGYYTAKLTTGLGASFIASTIHTTQDSTYTPYDLLVVPVITALSSNSGPSTGEPITITGRGFSTTPEDNIVTFEGQLCEIKSSTATTIQCALVKPPSPVENVPRPGHGGIIQRVFTTQGSIDAVKKSADFINGAGTINHLTSFEILTTGASDSFSQALEGLFKAPVTGNYRFLLSASAAAELYISTKPLNNTAVTLIAKISGSTAFRDFYDAEETQQISAPILLQAGNYYYMRAIHLANGVEHLTVGVRIPNAQRTSLSPKHVVSINIQANVERLQANLTIKSSTDLLNILIVSGTSIKSSRNITFASDAGTITGALNDIGISAQVISQTYYDASSQVVPAASATKVVFVLKFYTTPTLANWPGLSNSRLGGFVKSNTPSTLVSGTYTLSIGDTPVTLKFDETTDSIQTAIDNALATQFSTRAFRYRRTEEGAQFVVYFNGITDPVPQINVTANALTGGKSQVNVTVSVLQDSNSNDTILAPITADLLYTYETFSQITVQTNGVLASCAGNCQYQPVTVSDTTCVQLTGFSLNGSTLIIEFANAASKKLSNFVEVTFGGSDLDIISYDPSAQRLVCSVPLNPDGTPQLVAGLWTPRVYIYNFGYPHIPSEIQPLLIKPIIDHVQIDELAGGFLAFTFYGSHYGLKLCHCQSYGTAVTVGGVVCNPYNLNNTMFKCQVNTVVTSGPLTLFVNNISIDYPFTPQSNNIVKQITDDCYLDIIGQSFDSNTVVKLINNATGVINRCLSCLKNTTLIRCDICSFQPGNYTALTTQYVYPNYIQSSLDFDIVYDVYSISPNYGSQLGGTVITITGYGFSNTLNENQVSIGCYTGCKPVRCDVIESNTTHLKCVTSPNIYNFVGARDVLSMLRLQFNSRCLGNCLFTYSDSYTPQINQVNATAIKEGDIITVTGTYLSFDTQISFNGVVAVVVSVNSTKKISIQVPQLIANSCINVTAVDPQYGNYDIDPSIVFTSAVQLSDVIPKSGSAGGSILTITGYGFSSNAQVTVGGKACQISSVSTTQIICSSTSGAAGAIAITQDTFKNVVKSGVTYAASATLTPSVTSLTANFVSGVFTIVLNGAKLDVVSPITVALVSAGLTQPVTITSKSATAIVATISAPVPGVYTLLVTLGTNFPQYQSSISLNVTVPLIQTSTAVAITNVSQAGGSDLALYFTGVTLPQDLSLTTVKLGGFNCPVSYVNTNYLVCTIPPLATSKVRILNTQVTLTGTVFASSPKDTPQVAFDGDTGTEFTATSNNCYIGLDLGDGLTAELSKIQFFPKAGIDMSTLQGGVFEGSNDGAKYTGFQSISGTVYYGWNSFSFAAGSRPTYRYYRFRQNSATSKCEFAELKFIGALLSTVTITNSDIILFSTAVVTVNQIVNPNVVANVQYRKDYTASVTSVYPKLGTSAGNSSITIYGKSFTSVATDIDVHIDGTRCVVTSSGTTYINCVTGALPAVELRTAQLTGYIEVKIRNKGVANSQGVTYTYAERWSNSKTWGCGGLPIYGDSVHVPIGMNLYVDTWIPTLLAVVVEGGLIFGDMYNNFECTYLLIRGGFLRIGTEDTPIVNQISLTILGLRGDEQLPIFGNKGIFLYEGTIDMHGTKRSVMNTTLSQTAFNGSYTIVVDNIGDWATGDSIAISSTSNDFSQNEELTIVCVKGNTITLDSPLKYTHLAEYETINCGSSHCAGTQGKVQVKAVVILLSRNIIIQGCDFSEEYKYGVQMLFYDPGTHNTLVRIDSVEVRYAGQAGYINRHPINFMKGGDLQSSYVTSSSIHRTYYRGIVVKDTQYLTVSKNVFYDIENEAIMLPDGVERFNVIEDNVVIGVSASLFQFNSYRDPGAISITNPLNFLRRNIIAGVVNNGFTLVFGACSRGASYSTSICPQGENLGAFEDNSVLSSGAAGLFIDTHYPRTYSCRGFRSDQTNPFAYNTPVPAIYSRFKAIRAHVGIQAWYLGSVIFDSFIIADSQCGGVEVRHVYNAPLNSTQANNGLIVGNLILGNGSLQIPGTYGILVPGDDGFIVNGACFVHLQSKSPALLGCSDCANPWQNTASRVTFSQNLQFVDVKLKVDFTAPYTHIFRDLDGTLTNADSTGATVVYNLPHLHAPECKGTDSSFNGLVCNSNVEVKGINFWSITPSYMTGKTMRILQLNQNLVASTAASSLFTFTTYRYIGVGYSAPFVTGYPYQISVDVALDYDSVVIKTSPFYLQEDLPITLLFNYTEPREEFDINRTVFLNSSVAIKNSTDQFDIYSKIGISDNSFGDYYNDVTKKIMYFSVTGNDIGPKPVYDSNDAASANIIAYRCKYNCPAPEAKNVTTFTRYWSNATGWPSGKVPCDGEYVVIEETDLVYLDVDTASLDTLEIRGVLQFPDTSACITLTAKIIWVRGSLIAGNATVPYKNKAIIQLTGTRLDEPIVVNFAVDAGTKVLVVTGYLSLVGKQVNTVVRLKANALAGDNYIQVTGDISTFSVGDQILIAPSGSSATESEIKTITKIFLTNNTIVFSGYLENFHYGSATTYTANNGLTADMRTEVLLLSRNIQIQGTKDDGLGARVLVTEEYNAVAVNTGSVNIAYASLTFCGQTSTDRAGITFELTNTSPGGVHSNIVGTVIKDCVGYAVRFEASTNITFQNNVIVHASQYGILFEDNNQNIQILNNIICGVLAGGRPPIADLGDFSAGIAMYQETNTGITISQNIVIAFGFIGYLISAPSCGAANFFAGNVAHSGRFGYVAYGDLESCISIADFTAYRTEYGVISYYRVSSIQASGLFLTDNGISLNLASSADGGRNFTVTGSYFAAFALKDCPLCYSCSTACSSNAAIGLGVFTNETRPDKFQFYRSQRQYVLDNFYKFRLNAFENFGDTILPQCTGNQILSFSEEAIDFIPYVRIDQSTTTKVDQSSLALFRKPLVDDWNCGPEVQCTLVLNSLIKDVDGTLLGTKSPAVLLPNNPGVISSACTFSSKMNGYICKSGKFSLLGFKSLDLERSLVVLSPITISNSYGFYNKINSHRNNNPREPGDTQKFISIIQTNVSYITTFPRDMPLGLEFELQGEVTDYILVNLTYVSSRVLSVTNALTGVEVSPCLTVLGTGRSQAITTASPCGAYIFDRDLGTIKFKLTGESSCKLLIQQTNSLVANLRFDITIDEFFEQGGVAPFIDKVAAVLNIPLVRIRVVGLYQGSTGIIVALDTPSQGENSYKTAISEMAELESQLQAAIASGKITLYDRKLLSSSTEHSYAGGSDTQNVNGNSQNKMKQALLFSLVIGLPVILIVVIVFIVYKRRRVAKKGKNVIKIAPERFSAKTGEKEAVKAESPAKSPAGKSPIKKSPYSKRSNELRKVMAQPVGIGSGESRNNLAANPGSIDSFGTVEEMPGSRSTYRLNRKVDGTPAKRSRRASIDTKIEELNN